MKRSTFFGIVIAVALIASSVFYVLQTNGKSYDYTLLFGGNALLATVTMISYYLGTASQHNRAQSFVRGVYSGTLLKLFALAGGTLVYVLLNKTHFNKASFLLLGIMYFMYMAIETAALQKHTRKRHTS